MFFQADDKRAHNGFESNPVAADILKEALVEIFIFSLYSKPPARQ